MTAKATMRDLRNHTREVIERAQTEPITITDGGMPIAVIAALSTADGTWDADAWLTLVTGPDWSPYESGLAAETDARRQADRDEPDALASTKPSSPNFERAPRYRKSAL